MLALIRKLTCRVACLGLVLVSLEVIDNSVWVRFVSFRWELNIPPGTRHLVFPYIYILFDNTSRPWYMQGVVVSSIGNRPAEGAKQGVF